MYLEASLCGLSGQITLVRLIFKDTVFSLFVFVFFRLFVSKPFSLVPIRFNVVMQFMGLTA